MSGHGEDQDADRLTGHNGEVSFCRFALLHGWTVHGAHGPVRSELGLRCPVLHPASPVDVVLGKDGRTVAHEVKVKKPTWAGCYGLEEYRLEKFTDNFRQPYPNVSYTLYDGLERNWFTADAARLLAAVDVDPDVRRASAELTYYGDGTARLPMLYWPTRYWTPLLREWEGIEPWYTWHATPCDRCEHQTAIHVRGARSSSRAWKEATGACSAPDCDCPAAIRDDSRYCAWCLYRLDPVLWDVGLHPACGVGA